MSGFSLPPEIRTLPVAQRLVLVEEIWNSIAEDEASFELSDAHKTELDRRLQKHEADPERGVLWKEVKQRLLGDS